MPELPPSMVSADLSLNLLSGGMPRSLPDGLAFLAAFGNRLAGGHMDGSSKAGH